MGKIELTVDQKLAGLQKQIDALDAELKKLLTDENVGDGKQSVAIRMQQIFEEANKLDLEKTNARREKGALKRLEDAGVVYVSAAKTARNIVALLSDVAGLLNQVKGVASDYYMTYDNAENAFFGIQNRLEEAPSIAAEARRIGHTVREQVNPLIDNPEGVGRDVVRVLFDVYRAESR